MDHTEHHPETTAASNLATPEQRAHWNNWVWFTGMTKKGIVVVLAITCLALYFII